MSNVVDVLIKAIRLNTGGIRDEIRKCLIPLAKWPEIPRESVAGEPGGKAVTLIEPAHTHRGERVIDQDMQDFIDQQEAEAELQWIAETARNMHQTFRAKLIAAGMTEAEIDAPLEEEEE